MSATSSPAPVAPDAQPAPAAPRKYKRKQGTRSLQEIRKYQKSTACLLRRAPFQRLVREITQDYNCSMCWKKNALEAMQVAVEDYMTAKFNQGMCRAVASKRTTLLVTDLQG